MDFYILESTGDRILEKDSAISKMDIGNFIENSKLDDFTRLSVLDNAWVPKATHEFPCRNGRRFRHAWLSKWPWLSYSAIHDGAFCRICVLFGHQTSQLNCSKLENLFTKPLTNWQSATTLFHKHIGGSCAIHTNAMLDELAFRKYMSGLSTGIDVGMKAGMAKRIESNRVFLKSIVETVLLCGRQNIALRGHRDDSSHYNDTNPGNFQALLNFRVNAGDISLKNHFENAPKNATYRSKTIQNQLVDVIGEQIRGGIVHDINDCPFFSVIADEAIDCSNKEQMPLILRYVNADDDIEERFLKYIHCNTGLTGVALAGKIVETLKEEGIPIGNCRGQGYDGAGAMSSPNVGVAACIIRITPKAIFVHCGSHRLNLCVQKSCSILLAKNMIDNSGEVTRFFNNSAVRSSHLSNLLKESSATCEKLSDPCRTRWVARIESLDDIRNYYPIILRALEDMAYTDCFNRETTKDAANLIHTVSSFGYIVALVIVSTILNYSMPLTCILQERNMDVAKSLWNIQLLKQTMQKLRDNVEKKHRKWYSKALDIAREAVVPEAKPRTATRQLNRENYNTESVEEYYRIALTVPFLDHMIQQLDFRFSDNQLTVYRGLSILPKNVLVDSEWRKNFKEFAEMYAEDLPCVGTLNTELDMWAVSCKNGLLPPYKTIQDTIKDSNIDHTTFPNIYTMLKILAVLPVTSCEAERTISALRRAKTWLRSTMGEERLNGLAAMNINNDREVSVEKVIDHFARKFPRRMQFVDILQDEDTNAE